MGQGTRGRQSLWLRLQWIVFIVMHAVVCALLLIPGG